MPRSFLVKKPCSHRIPNYGALLDTQTDIPPSCSSCSGMLPLFQSEDPSISKLGVLQLRDPALSESPVDPAYLLCSGSRVKDDHFMLASGLPLKDNMNNLNLPLRIRASDEDSIMSGFKVSQHFPVQREAAPQRDSLGCLDCHRVFRIHKQRHYHGPARRVFSCQHCAKVYASLGALKMHIRTHTLPCACRICGKAFSRPWLLQGHIRTHTGEKPFSCLHCGRGFADRSNLRAHLQTHSEVKRYRCPGCGKTFSRVSLLAKHRDGCCCPVS